jgi:hypothetical protein
LWEKDPRLHGAVPAQVVLKLNPPLRKEGDDHPSSQFPVLKVFNRLMQKKY